MFSFAGNGDSFVSDGGCTQDRETCTQCHVPAHVIFLVQCSIRLSCQRLSHAQYVHVAQALCPHKNICLHSWRRMAHSTLSLMISPSLSISSLLTCTPIRLSTLNVSFGSLADLLAVASLDLPSRREVEDQFCPHSIQKLV